MKKILILGSGGVLGYSFKEKYFLEKYKKKYKFVFVNSKIIDLRNQKETIDYILKEKPYAVFHLAGSGGGIGRSYNRHASILRDNIFMIFNVIEGSRLANVKKLILTMSTGMFPEKAKIPLRESEIHNGEPVKYNFGNSFGKRIIEPAIRAYKEEYNMDIKGIIVSGIYGEGDNFNIKEANMLPAIIRKIIEAKKNNLNKIKIWGTGKPVREYTYAKDIRNIYMKTLTIKKTVNYFNVSSLQEKSIYEFVKIVCKLVNYNFKNVSFEKNKPDGIIKKTPSTKLFKSIMSYRFIRLEDGIKNTIKWYLNSKDINTKSKAKEFLM
jgi:GDP-L-fucose synthase